MITANYNPKEAEARIQKFWEEKKIFKFDPKSKKPVFSIDTPPPTVSGSMHLGHAFSYSQMDFVARFWRIRGYEIFYPFGTDDNGLPTERLVEKLKNVKASKMERKQFVKICLQTLKEITPAFIADWKRIGISADWSLSYTTINEHCQRISQKSFIDLYRIGKVYRKESPYIWCPSCETAIAQIELQDEELESAFNDVIFKLEDGGEILISTTRPELLPACVAIFVNPEDSRHKNLVGKRALVSLFNYPVPIMSDPRVDPQKGTGIVMCCTFGDQTDIEWFKAYSLSMKIAITKDGRMNELAGKYKGMKIHEARSAIIKDLKNAGLLKSSKKITHMVNVHDRCGTEIEILNTKQWFVRYLDLKGELLAAGRKFKWHPEFMRNRYDNWARGLQWDWCISMQRYFGIPFPLWYCKKCGKVMLADERSLPVDPLQDKPKAKCPCGVAEFEPEKDVFNTWATSALTPQIAVQLVKNEKIRQKLYPMDLRPQAHDIITFWLFNTVVKALLHTKKVPWKNAMISGWALDPHGRKMSKSKGNIIEPHDVLEKYSADALRFWAAGAKLGQDLPYQEKDLATAQKLITKLWNAARLVHGAFSCRRPKSLKPADAWLLSKLNKLVADCTEGFENYDYATAKSKAEYFFWHVYCDNYLEIIKYRLYKGADASLQWTLYYSFLTLLKLFAPITSFITEELYQKFFRKTENEISVHISNWPEVDISLIDKDAENSGDSAVAIISALRNWKHENKLPLNAELKEVVLELSKKDKDLLEPFLDDIVQTSKTKKLVFGKANLQVEGCSIRFSAHQ